MNETVPVGRCDAESLKLLMTAYKCLQKGIEQVKPGARYRDIGEEVTKVAHARGASVVKSYCGHGIGTLFHCAPNIPHYAKNKAVGTMKEGHVFTIEPMINAGDYKDVTWPDGVDGGDQGREPLGAVRAHHGGHRGGRRVAHGEDRDIAQRVPVERPREPSVTQTNFITYHVVVAERVRGKVPRVARGTRRLETAVSPRNRRPDAVRVFLFANALASITRAPHGAGSTVRRSL